MFSTYNASPTDPIFSLCDTPKSAPSFPLNLSPFWTDSPPQRNVPAKLFRACYTATEKKKSFAKFTFNDCMLNTSNKMESVRPELFLLHYITLT